jgi:pectin methylesterase-like acyl-CoA thioesterase
MAVTRPRRTLTRPVRPRDHRAARPFRPDLAALEARVLLTTFNVDDDGLTGFTTINAAIAAASAGDTIAVAAGTYTEQLDISKSLIVQGAGQGSTIIRAPATLATKVTDNGNPSSMSMPPPP